MFSPYLTAWAFIFLPNLKLTISSCFLITTLLLTLALLNVYRNKLIKILACFSCSIAPFGVCMYSKFQQIGKPQLWSCRVEFNVTFKRQLKTHLHHSLWSGFFFLMYFLLSLFGLTLLLIMWHCVLCRHSELLWLTEKIPCPPCRSMSNTHQALYNYSINVLILRGM